MTSNATPRRVIYAEYRELRPIPFLSDDGFWYVYFSTEKIAKIVDAAEREGISVEDWIHQAVMESLKKH